MVLFSLVLSLGLMVDNAIIIIEGVNEYISKHKKIKDVKDMISEILRINGKPKPTTGGMVREGYHGFVSNGVESAGMLNVPPSDVEKDFSIVAISPVGAASFT